MAASTMPWTPPSPTTHHCFRCQFTPEPDEPPLQRCAGCRSRHYCSRDCQRDDWHGGHKQECAILARAGTVAPRSRTTMRINGNQMETMLRRTDPASDQAYSDTSRNVDEDVIYYLKLSKPFYKDIAISGPFYPLSTIVPNIRAKLKGEGCDVTGSLEAFEEVFIKPGPFAYRGFEHFNATRPDGSILHILLVKQKIAEVARQMRQKQDNQRVLVWNVVSAEPDTAELFAQARVRETRGEDPAGIRPLKQMDIENAFLSKRMRKRMGGVC